MSNIRKKPSWLSSGAKVKKKNPQGKLFKFEDAKKINDKTLIHQYLKKISQLLDDPQYVKKAAMLIENMVKGHEIKKKK